jgi:hypothetical protein
MAQIHSYEFNKFNHIVIASEAKQSITSNRQYPLLEHIFRASAPLIFLRVSV